MIQANWTISRRTPAAATFPGPFPEQVQEQPGLTAPMDPLPDHGEESYQGSGALTGKAALITGGDSGIGKAVAIAFAREGADVAISYLPEEEDDAQDTAEWIRKAGRKVLLLPGRGPERGVRRPDRRGYGRGVRAAGRAGAERGLPEEPGKPRDPAPPRSSTGSSRPTSTRCSGLRGPRCRT